MPFFFCDSSLLSIVCRCDDTSAASSRGYDVFPNMISLLLELSASSEPNHHHLRLPQTKLQSGTSSQSASHDRLYNHGNSSLPGFSPSPNVFCLGDSINFHASRKCVFFFWFSLLISAFPLSASPSPSPHSMFVIVLYLL